AAEGDAFEVTLQSGRVVRGAIDARSDDAQLHLRSGTAAMRIVRPIGWGAIVSVKRGEERWAADELRRALPELATPTPRMQARLTPSPSDAAGNPVADP